MVSFIRTLAEMGITSIEFDSNDTITQTQLGLVTVTISNNDTLAGTGTLSLINCPSQVYFSPLSQPVSLSPGTSLPYVFTLYSSEVDP